MLGKKIIDLVVEEDRKLVEQNIRSNFSHPYEVRVYHKYGSVLFLEVHGEIISYHGRSARMTAIHDLTERKRSEVELLKRERNMAAVLNNSKDMVVRIDRDHRHIFANLSLYAGTGLSPEQYLEKTDEEIGMPEELCAFWREKHEKVFRSGEPEIFEFVFNTANRGERTFQAIVSPEFGHDNEVETIVGRSRYTAEKSRKLVYTSIVA